MSSLTGILCNLGIAGSPEFDTASCLEVTEFSFFVLFEWEIGTSSSVVTSIGNLLVFEATAFCLVIAFDDLETEETDVVLAGWIELLCADEFVVFEVGFTTVLEVTGFTEICSDGDGCGDSFGDLVTCLSCSVDIDDSPISSAFSSLLSSLIRISSHSISKSTIEKSSQNNIF